MIAEELINHMIPPLKLKDDAHKAILWMEELRSNELPVVDNEQFKGILTEEMILELNDVDKPVADFELAHLDCVVSKNSHFYDVLKVGADNGAKMVGVVDEEGKYIGVITIRDTITAFAQSAAVQMSGSILVLSINQIDYSLSEISRHIEENNAKILSSSVVEDELDASKLRVTLKINTLDLKAIIATLDRFDYKIIGRFQETKIVEEQKERIDMLLKYLDI
ncbi:MAG TPA: CBS domain-containing protein [Fulvivirga sp.]|nr:CBS domain-containing protein [Fulvivirga sp.]